MSELGDLAIDSEFIFKREFFRDEEVVYESGLFKGEIDELVGVNFAEMDDDEFLVDLSVDNDLVKVVTRKDVGDSINDGDGLLIEGLVGVLEFEREGATFVLEGIPETEEGEDSLIDDGGLLELSLGGAIKNVIGEISGEVGLKEIDGDKGGHGGEGNEDESEVGGVIDGEFLDGDSHEETDSLEEDTRLEDISLNWVEELKVDEEDRNDGGRE